MIQTVSISNVSLFSLKYSVQWVFWAMHEHFIKTNYGQRSFEITNNFFQFYIDRNFSVIFPIIYVYPCYALKWNAHTPIFFLRSIHTSAIIWNGTKTLIQISQKFKFFTNISYCSFTSKVDLHIKAKYSSIIIYYHISSSWSNGSLRIGYIALT